MMRRNLLLGLFIVIQLLFCSVVAASHSNIHSNQNGYFGLSGTNLDDENFSVSGGSFISGFDINQFFAVESQFGVVSENKALVAGIETQTIVNFFSSVRIRANYHMRKMIPYFYLGYTGMNVTTNVKNFNNLTTSSADTSEAGFSYGIGIDLFGSQTTSIFISTGMMLKDSDISLKSTSIGFRYYLSRKRPTVFH